MYLHSCHPTHCTCTIVIKFSLWKGEEFHSERFSWLQCWHSSVANVVWFAVQLQLCLLHYLQKMDRVHTHNCTVYMHSIYNIYHKHTSNRRDRGGEESGVEGGGEGEEGEIVVSRPASTLSRASLPLRMDGDKEAEGGEVCRYVQ